MITSVYVMQFQCPQDVFPLEHVGEIRLSIAGHGPYRWRPGRQISFRLEPQSDIPNSNTFKSFSLLLTLDKIKPKRCSRENACDESPLFIYEYDYYYDHYFYGDAKGRKANPKCEGFRLTDDDAESDKVS